MPVRVFKALRNKLLRNRERPPKSERPRSNFQSWCRLLALVLIVIDAERNVLHQL